MKHLIILLLFLISCTPREQHYCTNTSIIIYAKKQPNSTRSINNTYYLYGVDRAGKTYQIPVNKEDYQFTIVGSKTIVLICIKAQ